MPGLNIEVSLSEALEVRGGPLQEDELWAILCQATDALQDVFLTGEGSKDSLPSFAITPDSLLLSGNGHVQFAESSFNTVLNKDIVPPEYGSTQQYSDLAIEKMYIFALGMTVYFAADFRLGKHESLEISEELDDLLGAMCEEDPHVRSSLVQLLEACTRHSRNQKIRQPSTDLVSALYKLVLGSVQDLSRLDEETRDYLNRGYRNNRKRSPRQASKSRSRSRSRNRSRNRSQDARKQERPHPVGRDQSRDRSRSRHHGSHHSLPQHKADMYYTRPPSGVPRGEEPVLHIKDPRLRETYLRLKDRQRRLAALRQGLDLEDFDASEIMSIDTETDFGDRRSMISATSFTHGVYQPDLHSRYGSSVALKMGRDVELERDGFLGDENAWFEKQEKDIAAMQKAQRDFLSHQPRPLGDGGRSDEGGSRLNVSAPPPRSKTPTRPKTPHKHPNTPQQKPVNTSTPKKMPNKTPRKIYGPEFVYDEKPINVQLPQARNASPASLRHVNVILLDGQKLDVVVEFNTTSKELMDVVIGHIGLPEHYFFGLTFVYQGEHFFLDPETKLCKIAEWKEKKPSSTIFTTYFRVKFYVENVNFLKHPLTRHLYYLQLRRDILEERTHCTEDQAVLLAAIAMQAEYGDWHDKAKDFVPEHYVARRTLHRVGRAFVRDTLPERHKKYTGLSDTEAENEFMKEMQTLPEYGIHFYKVYRTKKDTHNFVWTGIGIHGVLMADRNNNDTRSVTQRHPWHYTQKISFNRRRFSILPKSEAGPVKLAKFNYYTDSYKKGRYLLQLCKAHHTFQMMIKMRLGPETLESRHREYEDEDDDFEEDFEGEEVEDIDDYDDHQEELQNSPPGRVDAADFVAKATVDDDVDGMDDSFEDYSDNIDLSEQTYPRDNNRSPPFANLSSRNTPVSQLNRSMTPGTYMESHGIRASPGAPDRRILLVELPKDSKEGIGITIVGGENTGKLDLGVFVKSITPSGPADRDGRVRAGDRIIAINGKSLEGMPHHVAVELIRESPQKVQLLISQSSAPLPFDPEDRESSPSLNEMVIEEGLIADRGFAAPKAKASASKVIRPDPRRSRSPSICSTDLELENVIPQEALQQSYIEKHMKEPTITPDVKAMLEGGSSNRTTPSGRARTPGAVSNRTVTPGGASSRGTPKHNMEDGYVSDEELEEAMEMSRSYHGNSRSTTPGRGTLSTPEVISPTPSTEGEIKPGDMYEVVLHKKNGSLGLNVTGGVNTSVREGGIIVKSFAPDGAAESDGRIRIGDRVLEVNGFRLLGVTHKQAVETLRSAPESCHLVMERGTPPTPKHSTSQPPSVRSDSRGMADDSRAQSRASAHSHLSEEDSKQYPFVTSDNQTYVHLDKTSVEDQIIDQENRLDVSMHKDSGGLGFSIVGGRDAHPDPMLCIVRVKKIFPVGPAAESDILREGDVILAVNNTYVKNLTHQEVLTLLRAAPSQVKLEICRPDPLLLPSLQALKYDSESPYTASTTPTTMKTPSSVVSPQNTLTPGPDEYAHHDQYEDESYIEGDTDSEEGDRPQMSPESRDMSPRSREMSPQSPYSGHDRSTPGDQSTTTQQYTDRTTPQYTDRTTPQSRYDDSMTTQPTNMTTPQSNMTTPQSNMTSPQSTMTTPHQHDDDSASDSDLSEMVRNNRDGLSPVELQPNYDFIPGRYDVTAGDKTPVPRDHNQNQNTPTPDSEQSNRSRTPTPVKSFLKNAGLDFPTPSATPPVDSGETSEDDETESDETLKPGEFDVTLTKGEKGLGFTVAGGQQTTGYFYVKDVLYDPALGDGRIERGDRLIKVEGHKMSGLSHKDAVMFLRQTPQTVNLRFYKPPEDESPKKREDTPINTLNSDTESRSSRPVSSSSPGQHEDDQRVSPGPQHVEDTSDPRPSVKDLAKHLEKSQTLIKPVQYGEKYKPQRAQSTEEEYDPHTEEPPSEASSFGDLTLPMSDLEVRGGESPNLDRMVERNQNMMSPYTTEGGVIQVALEKPPSGSLGFALVQGERGVSSALFVKSINPGGAADMDGRLKVGDRLLQVNGESVIGMPHNKAVALIKKSKSTVLLAVSRTISARNTPCDEYNERATPAREYSTTPARELHAESEDTDSDVDSDTLDEDDTTAHGTTYQDGTHGTSTSHSLLQSQEFSDDDDKTENTATLDSEAKAAFNRLTERTSGVGKDADSSDDDDDTWNNAPSRVAKQTNKPQVKETPKKPPRTPRKTNTSILPSMITDDWLSKQPVVTPPPETMHYTGRELTSTVKQLKIKMNRDDPLEEYKGLKHAKLTDNCTAARKQENKTKNRYRNVLPYDATRVCLSGNEDYINASHVRYPVGKEYLQYIACQGPLPNTSTDFWRMVWERKSNVVAMLTQDTESGKVKCHRYWPDDLNKPAVEANRFEISLLQVHELEHFDVHLIKMEELSTGNTHRVTHVSFKAWPDHGSPASALPLLQYIRFLHMAHESGPIVVHCSAGIGRTGALITIDVVLSYINKDLKFNIQRIVEDLRRQRQGMIQTKDQYNFCYLACVEALEQIKLL